MTGTLPDRDAEMMAALAEIDFSAARHVHAKLMAATETDEIADLSRAYQRASRCLRQTLALKAKLVQDAERHHIHTRPTGPRGATDFAAVQRELIREDQVGARISMLQDAVGRLIYAETPDFRTRVELSERLDLELDDWIDEPDFTTAQLEVQIRRACRVLSLPEDRVPQWRTLPKPPPVDPDLDWDDDDGEIDSRDDATPPAADTG
jgi:hypothetical protein